MRPVRPVLVVGKRAALNHRRAEQLEKCRSHLTGWHLFDLISDGQVDGRESIRRQIVECRGAPAPGIELGGRGSVERAFRERSHEGVEPIRIRVRRGLQQDGVDDGEDRCVRTDAERQRQHGNRRESRRLPQAADCVAQVMEQSVHGRASLRQADKITLQSAPQPYDHPARCNSHPRTPWARRA